MPKHNTPRPPKPAQPPADALFQAMSLARKAGRLVMGFDAVEEAAVKGKAWLVLTAADASPKTVQRLRNSIGDLVDVLSTPLTMNRLAPLGRRPVAVCAVTDRNLAKLCYDRLDECGVIKHEEEMTE